MKRGNRLLLNNNMKILGVITARGGSKRVPRKNIKEFLGRPLLAWTIEAGIQSEVFDRFILTTDDKEIADTGEKYGVEVPFIRPQEFATDTSSSYDAIKHAVEWLNKNQGYKPDWIILLEPASPGRQPFHIKEVAKIIEERSNIDSLVGITEMPGHFSYLKEQQIDRDGIITRVCDGEILRNLIQRNQDLPKSYFINGAIYAFKLSNLFDGNNSLWGDNTYGYIMDAKYAMDIDTPEDWLIMEIKMKKILEK